MTTRILAFAGSTGKPSYNKIMTRAAVEIAEWASADVTFLDRRDLPMPLDNDDLEDESGIPENGLKLREKMMSHDGFLLSYPECNSRISGMLKYAIDRGFRPLPDKLPLVAFREWHSSWLTSLAD